MTSKKFGLTVLRKASGYVNASVTGWLDDHTYRDGDDSYLTKIGATAHFPELPSRSIQNWGTMSCRFLENNRPIHTTFVVPPRPRNHPRVRVYSKSDLQDIAIKRRSQRLEQSHRDEDGKAWLSNQLVCQKYGVSLGFGDHWKKRPSKIRPGRALRSKMVTSAIIKKKGGRGMVEVFLQEDVETILSGKEHLCPGLGRGCGPARLRNEIRIRGERFVRELLRDGPLPADLVIERCRNEGVKRTIVYQLKKDLRIYSKRNGPGYWHWWLPGTPREQRNSQATGPTALITGVVHVHTERARVESKRLIIKAGNTTEAHTAWSIPCFAKVWQELFRLSYPTLMARFRDRTIRAKKIGRKWAIHLDHVPKGRVRNFVSLDQTALT